MSPFPVATRPISGPSATLALWGTHNPLIANSSPARRTRGWPRYEAEAKVEAAVLELRRSRPYWEPRRLLFELAKRRADPKLARGVGRSPAASKTAFMRGA